MGLKVRNTLVLILFIATITFGLGFDTTFAQELAAEAEAFEGEKLDLGELDFKESNLEESESEELELEEPTATYLDVEILQIEEFNKFADIYSQAINPYYDSIYKVASAGIMRGVSTEIFDPNKPVTRGEFAVILVKVLDLQETENNFFQLDDVPENHWAYKAIALVLKDGMMQPKAPNEFRLEEHVTKEEVLYPLEGLNVFQEKTSKAEITRGEMAYFLDQWYKQIKNQPLIMPDLIQLHDEDIPVTENFVYTSLGKYSPSPKTVTTKMLADILATEIELTYDNYLYYRYKINDTANLNIVKLYSEGILQTDADGNISPNKKLTRKEVREIISRRFDPIIPERPEYVARNHVPILMYHKINPLPKDGPTGLYVSKDNFKKQLDSLKAGGYNTITMDQLYNHWESNLPIPPNPVVLTFDDGYISHYDFASVELNKRGMTGTFYIITSMVDVDHIRTSARLKEMYEEGMEIASHTVTHIDARYSSNAKIAKEYKESKEYLEKVVGSEINHFCYPIGGVTPYARQTLKNLGYKTAVRTTYGKASKSQGLFDLRRIRIDYHDSIRGFLGKIK